MSMQNSALARRRQARAAGFTMVELITVMLILGIIAVTILPRFADKSSFEARGFRDETVSLLRYAQKSAVAQRRTVCVTVGGSGVSLRIANDPGATDCTASVALSLPSTPRNGSGLAGSNFNFFASGATNQSGTVSLTVSGASAIQIDGVTGYVR